MKKLDGNIFVKKVAILILFFIIAGTIVYSIPNIFSLTIQNKTADNKPFSEFPVTVDPINKLIVENYEVNLLLNSPGSPLQASVMNTKNIFGKIFEFVAIAINESSLYQNIASVDGNFITIPDGMRKEQVVAIFSEKLKWNKEDRLSFITPIDNKSLPLLPLKEGSFISGTYFISSGSTPENVQEQMNERFTEEVLSRYSDAVSKKVPLEQALIVASLVQRETIGNNDMRLISGIIWNRIFAGMKLQVDATLQYAKASESSNGSWWPKVVPDDKYIKSSYNTYKNKGLPPNPIASPNVAAILATLNPIKTPCMYYFNDQKGDFHCSVTYEEHVSKLKAIYGRGK